VKTASAKAILVAASLLFPVCCFAQTKSKEAAAYANSGIAKLQKNDLGGAIADFNRALERDPQLAVAYYARGVAKRR
jgi:Tfp pilus assembly protein PilF